MPGSWNATSSFVGSPSSSLGAGINKATALSRLRRKWTDPRGLDSLRPLSNAFHQRSTPDSGSSDSHAVIFIFQSLLDVLCAFARDIVYPIFSSSRQDHKENFFDPPPWRPLRLCESNLFPDSVIQNSTKNFKYIWLELPPPTLPLSPQSNP